MPQKTCAGPGIEDQHILTSCYWPVTHGIRVGSTSPIEAMLMIATPAIQYKTRVALEKCGALSTSIKVAARGIIGQINNPCT